MKYLLLIMLLLPLQADASIGWFFVGTMMSSGSNNKAVQSAGNQYLEVYRDSKCTKENARMLKTTFIKSFGHYEKNVTRVITIRSFGSYICESYDNVKRKLFKKGK